MKILAIGAHPDDIEIGCGGFLVEQKERGADLSLYVATYGEYGGNKAVRRAEQVNSAIIIGSGTNLVFGDIPSEKLEISRDVIWLLESHIEKVDPDVILTHDPEDNHQDHRNLTAVVMVASRHRRNILYYEGFSTTAFSPSIFYELFPDTLEKKINVLSSFRSQVNKVVRGANMSVEEAVRANAVVRGIQARSRYAEAFRPARMMASELAFYLPGKTEEEAHLLQGR